MRIQGQNPDALRKAMEQVGGKPLEQLNDTEKASALQQVAGDLGIKPAALLKDLESAFPDVFSTGPANKLEQFGAAAQYSASAGQMQSAGKAIGAQIASLKGGSVASMAQFQTFVQADNAGDIRDKAAKLPDMMQAYAGITAGQLFDDVKVPPRVQTVARKALEGVADKTSAHFSPEGFQVKDDPKLNKLALGQHTGYVAGELSRTLGVDEPTARKALMNYFEGGGDVDKLISEAGLPGKDNADFWNNNGWMFAGGMDDNKNWGFWGFGAADQALNRPGVYAGEATLKVAEALDKGNGPQLLAQTLTKAPEDWNDNEKVVGNFALRSAQLGWMTSKLGQGVVEANNPKKEDRAAGRWAPGNDLITDFNSMAEAKGWKEVAKDLDQIKSFATSMGILTPGGNAANSSYYAQRGGEKLDRGLLHAFERSQAGPRDGRVSKGDIDKNVRPEILDGSKVTDTELKTISYAKENFNLTPAATKELEGLEVEAKLTRADSFGAHAHMFVEGDGHTPDSVSLRTQYDQGQINITFRDSDSNYGGMHNTDWAMKIDGKAVDSTHHKSGPIPYGEWEGETQSTHQSKASLKSGTHLVELENERTGETMMMKVSVPELMGADKLDFTHAPDVVSSAQKFVIPVPELKGEPLVYPPGHKDAGEAIADWRGDPIGDEGIVFFNEKDQAVQAVPTDGNCVIMLNQVPEEAGQALMDKLGSDPSKFTLASIKEALDFARSDLELGDQYNSTNEFVGDKLNKMESMDSGAVGYGMHRRDDRDVCQAVFIEGAGAFQGPPGEDGAKKPPQYFTEGAVIVQQGPERRLVQPDIFAETYRNKDGTALDLDELLRAQLE